MRAFLANLDRVVVTLLQVVSMFLITTLTAIMALQVFRRFVMNKSLDWPDELAPVLLALMTFVGAALAMRENEHVKFDVLAEWLPRFWGDLSRVLVNLIVLTVLSVYVWFSIPLIDRTWDQMMLTSNISIGFLYLIIPITSAIMIAYEISHSPLTRRLRDRRADDQASGDPAPKPIETEERP